MLKCLLKFFFVLNVPAKQARKLCEKLRRKPRPKLRHETAPLQNGNFTQNCALQKPSACNRGHLRPSGPKSKKIENGFRGLSAPGVEKIKKKSKKSTRGPPTTHHPHKNCRNLRQRQNTHHPQFCTRGVDRRFCGGGAWISRPEVHL